MQWCFILQKRPIILVVVPFCSLLNGLQIITLRIARSQSGSDSAPVSPTLSLPPSYKCDRSAACSTTPRNKNTMSCEPADFHYKLIDWKRCVFLALCFPFSAFAYFRFIISSIFDKISVERYFWCRCIILN